MEAGSEGRDTSNLLNGVEPQSDPPPMMSTRPLGTILTCGHGKHQWPLGLTSSSHAALQLNVQFLACCSPAQLGGGLTSR
jgi:hypothetical protein